MNQEEKLKKGQNLAKKALFLESGLAALKGLIGWFTGSLVLLSDALHSASDLVSIATSWLGLKIAQKKASEKFPYGFYKAENLAALLISFLIFAAAWEMFSQALERMTTFSSLRVPWLALGIALADALILFFFGRLEIKVGREINAQSLIAMGEENRTHLFSSSAVFLGILSAWLKIPYFEGLITLAIGFLILKIAFTTARDSVLALMDVSPGPTIEKKVVKAIQTVPGIEGFSDLRLRKAGPFIFGEVKLEIRKFVKVSRAQALAERVEDLVKSKVPEIDSLTINVAPFKSDFQHLVFPVKAKKGLNSPLSDSFGRAPWFLFVNLKKKKVRGYYFLKNPHQKVKMRAGLAAAKLVVEKKTEVLVTPQIGEIAFYTLRDHLIDVYLATKKTAKGNLESFLKDELKVLKKPVAKEAKKE